MEGQGGSLSFLRAVLHITLETFREVSLLWARGGGGLDVMGQLMCLSFPTFANSQLGRQDF